MIIYIYYILCDNDPFPKTSIFSQREKKIKKSARNSIKIVTQTLYICLNRYLRCCFWHLFCMDGTKRLLSVFLYNFNHSNNLNWRFVIIVWPAKKIPRVRSIFYLLLNPKLCYRSCIALQLIHIIMSENAVIIVLLEFIDVTLVQTHKLLFRNTHNISF